MRRFLRAVGVLVVVVVVAAVAAYAWARSAALKNYNRAFVAHDADFPIPFALTETELAALRAERMAPAHRGADPLGGVDLTALAQERAVARGRHLVQSRLGCNGCHGEDFGGAVIIDMPLLGYWAAPNLTSGEGSATAGFTARDWDRAVRHGLRRDGRGSSMPALEFANLSDHELSDAVSYIRSLPPVNRTIGPVRFGPVFAFMVALDPNFITAASLDHQRAHLAEPPPAAVTASFGNHLVQVCRGCHGPNLSGGKMEGDPNMPIVANLTPHESGLASWSQADFMHSIRNGKRPDGSAISEMMPWKAFGRMTDTELGAIWTYLRTLPPVPKGTR